MKVISIANQKGGVSKTTTTQAITTLLNMRGKKTLAIDLDPQGNLTFAMGVKEEDQPTIYDVLKGTIEINKVLHSTHSGDLLPSNILLSGADIEFTSVGREYILKEAILKLSNKYDYIVIDCPPSLSILTINAFVASNYIVIPLLADSFSLQGLGQLNNTMQSIKKHCNPDLEIAGILLTKFNSRTNLSNHLQETLKEVSEQLSTRLFNSKIRNSISMQEAQLQQENIFTYDLKSNAITDYKSFIEELEGVINV